MNGVHDMGGMDGFGRVEAEPREPVFHAPWEGRVIAMMRAMGGTGAWNLDMFRDAREHQAPLFYLSASYYRSWEASIETLVLGKGLASADELAAGHSFGPGKPLPRPPLTAAAVVASFHRGSYGRAASGPARFAIGDPVRTRSMSPATHTRLPRYARGHLGIVERIHGAHVYPDSSAIGRGDDPQWLYTVVFTAREIWGEDGDPAQRISIEAFEPYLEPG